MFRDDHAIHVSALHKTYPASGRATAKHALRGVDLTVESGEITGGKATRESIACAEK